MDVEEEGTRLRRLIMTLPAVPILIVEVKLPNQESKLRTLKVTDNGWSDVEELIS